MDILKAPYRCRWTKKGLGLHPGHLYNPFWIPKVWPSWQGGAQGTCKIFAKGRLCVAKGRLYVAEGQRRTDFYFTWQRSFSHSEWFIFCHLVEFGPIWFPTLPSEAPWSCQRFPRSPLHRKSSMKWLHRGCLCFHRGWLCIAQGVVILQKSNPDQFHDHLTVIIRLTSGHLKGPL